MKKFASAFPTNPAYRFSAFTPLAPSLSGVSPSGGVEGEKVRILGTGLDGATNVRFDGVEAEFWIDNDGSITATLPAGTGIVTLEVETPAGTDSGTYAYGGSSGDPAEWGGLTPFLDWDPANATAGLGGVLATLPDSSGNGRDAAQATSGGYPFVDLPMPQVITSVAFGSVARQTLEFRGNPNVDAYAPSVLLPTMPAGPYAVALVLYSDMPDHAAMPSGGGGTPVYTNNYALSSQGDAIGVYASGGTDRGFHAWGDPSFGEPAPSADFASTPTVLLVTSTGESSVGANDATISFYAKSLTPALTPNDRAPVPGVPWLLGSYQGGMTYSLQGEIARVLAFDVDVTAQAADILNALGAKYGISIAP